MLKLCTKFETNPSSRSREIEPDGQTDGQGDCNIAPSLTSGGIKTRELNECFLNVKITVFYIKYKLGDEKQD